MLSLIYIQTEYEKDNSNLNKLYEEVIIAGPESFPSFDEFSNSVGFLVKKFVAYNDYLHSNNLLQNFRTHCLNSRTPFPSWYHYFSIKIYSKRSIKYYLDNPSKFWEVVYKLSGLTSDDYIERLDNLIVDTLEFYKKEYINYPEFLHDSIERFIRYYKSEKPYSSQTTEHINELNTLIKSKDKNKVQDIYNSLKSQNILDDEALENVGGNEALTVLEKVIESEEDEENLYGDIRLSPEDSKKKILIVGDDPFVHKKSIIEGIGKTYGVNKDQFEYFDDYSKLKTEGEKIINRTQWNEKYIGIIFGSVPHKTTGNGDDSSIIAKCTSTAGFPTVVVCRQNNKSGKPKITASSFKNALRQIILAYKS